jgi:hypothetical protein
MELREGVVIALAVIAVIAGTTAYESHTHAHHRPTVVEVETDCFDGATETASALSRLGDEELRLVGSAVLAAKNTRCALIYNGWASRNARPLIVLTTG